MSGRIGSDATAAGLLPRQAALDVVRETLLLPALEPSWLLEEWLTATASAP